MSEQPTNDAPIGVPPAEFHPERPAAPFKKSGKVRNAILLGIVIIIVDLLIYFFLIKPEDHQLLPMLAPSPAAVQPSSKPVAVDATANWKPYKNEKMRFSAKLPPGWISHKETSVGDQDQIVFSYPVDSDTTQVWKQGQEIGLAINAYKNNGIDAATEAAQWVADIEKKTPNTFAKPLKTITIDGQKATVADTTAGNLEYIYVSNNDTTYVFIFGTPTKERFTKHKPTFTQFLSTFTFTAQDKAQQASVAELAKEDLAKRLKIDIAAIKVTSEQATTWNDGSMGCPKPGMMYTQALIEGTKVLLSAEGKSYPYHAGKEGTPFLCENSGR